MGRSSFDPLKSCFIGCRRGWGGVRVAVGVALGVGVSRLGVVSWSGDVGVE